MYRAPPKFSPNPKIAENGACNCSLKHQKVKNLKFETVKGAQLDHGFLSYR